MLLARIFHVGHFQFARPDHAAIAPGQADRFAAGDIDQADDVLLHLAGQHPFDDFHRLVVSHPHALDELPRLAQAAQGLLDLRPAAMHHHRIQPDQFQQYDILGKIELQRRVGHRIAAVLDDDGLAVKAADIGQSLREDLRLVARRDMGHVGAGGGGCRLGCHCALG